MRTHIDNVQENTILGETIYNDSGLCLVNKGVKLTNSMLNRLRFMGISSIKIEDDRLKGIDIKIEEPLSETTKYKALGIAKNILHNFNDISNIEKVYEVNDVINQMLDEILTNTDVGVNINSIQAYDSGTYTHSLSVTILSLYLAKHLELKKEQLYEIAIGGLLHDLGKLKIPLEILNKPGKLTNDEFDIVKLHPKDGYDAVKHKIPLLSAHIALQHHEKYDGTGYPRKLKGENIHLYGRISAIADVYDAVTADRPYREGMKPHKALDLLIKSSGTHFDENLLCAFFQIISPFPNGSIVILNNGYKGVVTKQNQGSPLRPQLLILEINNNPLKEFKNLDLKYQQDYFIIDICK